MAFEKETFFYQSADGKTPIAAYIYTPRVGSIRAVVQIAHGMCEYLERYESFIDYLCERGYMVCGNDHLGHGNTAKSTDDLGYIPAETGHKFLIEDLYALTQIVKLKYPNIPFILLGHSMGSMLARLYAPLYGGALNGLILCGTLREIPIVDLGLMAAKIEMKRHGVRGKSKFLDKISFGSYNNRILDPKSEYDWLSNDIETVESYNNDPLCGFKFTTSSYHELYTLLKLASSKKWYKQMPKHLPTLLISGDHDPVGGYGVGVERIYHKLKNSGMRDVIIKIYSDNRHEVLNEVNRYDVYKDVLKWCERIINLYRG